jgi:hypothetical protein
MTTEQPHPPSPARRKPGSSETLGDTLRWAFEFSAEHTHSGPDFIAREIVPGAANAFEAILAPATSLEALCELKSAFKMLRSSSASAAERSLAARLYAGTIAAALIRHRTNISSQSSANLARAFGELSTDDSMPERLREIAALAIDFAKNQPNL